MNTLNAPKNTLHIGKLLLAVSEAMDLISPTLQLHQQRVAYIAWQLSLVLGLAPEASLNLFNAALLHDIGALAPEDKLALHRFEVENPQQHCILGEMLFDQVSWLRPAAEMIRYHHTPWKTWDGAALGPQQLGAQVLLASDLVERLMERDRFILFQAAELQATLRQHAGSLLAPEVVEAFTEAASHEVFWLELTSPHLSELLRQSPLFQRLTVQETDLAEFSLLLRGIIDFRSPFTAAHSAGVAACARKLGEKMGLSPQEAAQLEMAGNLHDVGKLAVPNRIVEKNNRLTNREFAVMRQHAYYTYVILGTLNDFEQARQWAAYHHERLDGSGYPFKLKGPALTTGARIMAVADMYTAVTETRPYRSGLPESTAAGLVKRSAFRGQFDPEVVNVLLHDYADITAAVRSAQAESYQHYARHIQPNL